MTTVRVVLPAQLRTLARVGAEVSVEVPDVPTIADLLDALEFACPALRGTIRDQTTGERRSYMRYLACGEDLSHASPSAALPERVAGGEDAFRVVGAIAGGSR